MTQPIQAPVLTGDKAPPCYGMDTQRAFYSFEAQYGRPVILILAGPDAASGLHPIIDAFAAMAGSFASRNADILLVLDDNPLSFWVDRPVSIRTIDCGAFLNRCGVGARESLVLVLDRNLRVMLQSTPDTYSVVACLDCLDELPHERQTTICQPAPAIVLPNLLPRDLCHTLFGRFESSPTIDGAVARVDAAGNVCSVVDHAKKCRRDMPVDADDPLHGLLQACLLRRCTSEIAKAFQVKIAHIDRILVSRYDAGAGWFRRHRDNTADNVAFRQFALSINLNTHAYEGGDLSFPEYNDHAYRPPTGGGLIFSSTVLHEAAPVTAGSRYVLLTFLHSEEAELRRRAYLAATSDRALQTCFAPDDADDPSAKRLNRRP